MTDDDKRFVEDSERYYSRTNRTSDPGFMCDSDVVRLCRIIRELEAVCDRLKSDYEHACETIAKMHAAAVGEVCGPKLGVIEDIAALRAEIENAPWVYQSYEGWWSDWIDPNEEQVIARAKLVRVEKLK